MKTKLLLLFALTFGIASTLTWAQDERKLVIHPALPDSDDPIMVSVTNSGCYSNAEVFPATPSTGNYGAQVRLTYLTGPYGECLQDNPDAPDFETTMDPLPPGEYRIALFVNTGAHGSNFTDSKPFTVIEALPSTTLSEGGITGLYFNPAADGSYISVLETDYNTLVIWNTFDADGNQLWVYGVGDGQDGGSTVVAETYINRGTGFLPNGEVDAEAERWGLLRLDLASCTEGTFTYHSDLPEFDSGQFPIVRLAYSKQIGCVESE